MPCSRAPFAPAALRLWYTRRESDAHLHRVEVAPCRWATGAHFMVPSARIERASSALQAAALTTSATTALLGAPTEDRTPLSRSTTGPRHQSRLEARLIPVRRRHGVQAPVTLAGVVTPSSTAGMRRTGCGVMLRCCPGTCGSTTRRAGCYTSTTIELGRRSRNRTEPAGLSSRCSALEPTPLTSGRRESNSGCALPERGCSHQTLRPEILRRRNRTSAARSRSECAPTKHSTQSLGRGGDLRGRGLPAPDRKLLRV